MLLFWKCLPLFFFVGDSFSLSVPSVWGLRMLYAVQIVKSPEANFLFLILGYINKIDTFLFGGDNQVFEKHCDLTKHILGHKSNNLYDDKSNYIPSYWIPYFCNVMVGVQSAINILLWYLRKHQNVMILTYWSYMECLLTCKQLKRTFIWDGHLRQWRSEV